jgi:hypothetical protein
MSIAAHTNQVGYHQKSVNKFSTTEGIFFFQYRKSTFPFSYVEAVSDKSGTIRSNGSIPTYYRRRVSRVTEDRPGKVEYKLYNPVIGRYIDDYSEEQFMSYNQYVGDFPFGPQYQNAEENAKARSLTECLLKLQEVKTEVGVDLLEAKKSVAMFAGLARTVAGGLHNFRRGIPRQKLVELANGRELSNRWLEYQYGWKPLYGALHDAAQIALTSMHKDLLIHARKSTPWAVTSPLERDQHFEKQISGKGGVKTHILARLDYPWVAKTSALGLANPAAIGWELLPYSFVIDWFVPIGNFLNAITASAGLGFVWGYQSTQRNVHVERRMHGDGWWPRVVTEKGSTKTDHFEFERRVMGNFEMPRLYAKDNPFSTAHILNAAALVRGLF